MPPEEDVKKWRTVYATYFDKKLSLAEGRRLPVEKCLEKPNIYIIKFAFDILKIPNIMDLISRHPRDSLNKGRIKFKFLNDNGMPYNSEVGTSKKKLYNALSETWPEAL